MTERGTPAACWARVRLTAGGLRGELRGSRRLARDRRAFLQFVAAALAYRVQRVLRLPAGDRPRTVRFKNDVTLTYRLNRGDIRAIAEVWMSHAYELPFDIRPANIIDLGANIGAASVWFATRYGCTKLVAVEPVSDSARVARINLTRLDIEAEVIEAAVGPRAGTARFETNATSTLGRLSDEGVEVAVITVPDLIERFLPGERISLLKMDIEGGEEELFNGDTSWLSRVDCLVVELHTDRVDSRGIISALERAGFTRHPISEHNLYRGPADLVAAFRRPASTHRHALSEDRAVN